MNTLPAANLYADSAAPIMSVRGVNKTYAGGFQALKNINLDIRRDEIFALLGPNGAGKTCNGQLKPDTYPATLFK